MTLRRAMTRIVGHPVAWLVVLVLLFFYKEVFLGRVFSPADLLFDFRPWSAQVPNTFTHPLNPLRSDEAFIFFPRRDLIAHDVARYGLPIWQDHIFAGTPNSFSIGFLGAFVYPPMWSYLALPPGLANTLIHLPIPLLAGLCMYLLLGRLSRQPLVRLLGALAWALNGYFIVWLSAFFLPLTLAVLPLLIYLAIRFLDEGRLFLGLGYAVLLGWTFYLGYPPANVMVVTTVAIVVAYWLALDLRHRARRSLLLAGLSALGLGIAALPILTSIVELSRAPDIGLLRGMSLKVAQAYLFPNVFGNPVAYDWRIGDSNYNELVAYFGSVPLILGLTGGLSVIARRDFRNPLPAAAGLIGLLALAIAYGLWPASFVQHLPVFKGIEPQRWNIIVIFAAILLSVYALDLLLAGRDSRWSVGAAVGIVLVAATVIVVGHHRDLTGTDQFIKHDYVIRIVILGASIAALASLLRFRSSIPVGMLIALLAVDLFSFGSNYNPAIRPADFYPSTPALRYLAANAAGYRVLVARKTDLIWPGDVLSVYGIDSVTGYDQFRDAAYVRVLGSNMSAEERDFWRRVGYLTLGQALDLDSPVFDWLSVKYAYYPYASGEATPPLTHWHLAYQGADGQILENTRVLPRQFILRGGDQPPVAISHLAASPNHDRLTADGPGMLVWSKPYSRDWTVTVDGRPTDTGTYAGYFLRVDLPAGTHSISLAYHRTDYEVGAIVSLLSLLAAGMLMAFPRLRRAMRR